MGRTKVDALKDLGNKLTGSTLATRQMKLLLE